MNTDIDQQLANMGIPTRFEQSGVETLTLARDDGTTYLVTVLRDPDGMRLHLTVRCSQPLPDVLTRPLFVHLAHQALEPMRGGDGIGIYPDSDRLTLYRTRDLRTPILLADEMASMLDLAELWDSRLLEATSNPLVPNQSPFIHGLMA